MRSRLNTIILAYIVYCVSHCLAMSLREPPGLAQYIIDKPSGLDQQILKNERFQEENHIDGNEWENSGKFEGDMLLSRRQRLNIIRSITSGGTARNGLKNLQLRWPKGTLIYIIQYEDFSKEQIKAIHDAMDTLSSVSCIKFREYSEIDDRYAVIIKGDKKGCFSHVGYRKYDFEDFQVINLSAKRKPGTPGWCFRTGTIMHELLHALGFFHMHSNPNRDEYVRVNWENIIAKSRKDFLKYNIDETADYNVPYDFGSIMHYRNIAFSFNRKETLTPLKPIPKNIVMGQRESLTESDIKKLNFMYCNSMSSHR